MNLSSTWKAVEGIERDGETVQVIKGTLTLGKGSSTPEYQYKINGTLSTNKRQKIIYFSTPHIFPLIKHMTLYIQYMQHLSTQKNNSSFFNYIV